MYGPKTDGVDHINVYSKGRTSLGRWLSNFAFSPFNLADHGSFASVEGFWYWLGTGLKHDHLRHLFGAEAKKEGKKLDKVQFNGDFEATICSAIRCKLLAHPKQLSELIDTDLPLTHYYWFGYSVNNCKVLDAGYKWITEYIDSVRQTCKDKGWKPKQ